MAKIFRLYMADTSDRCSPSEVWLDLPASPYELKDALERMNVNSWQNVSMEVDEFLDFEFVQASLPSSVDLPKLNALTEALAAMGEHQKLAFCGLLLSEPNGPKSYERLLDLADSAEDCCIAESVADDAQLGRFYCDNGFIPITDTVPEDAYELLGFQKLGRQAREAEHGSYVYGNYVVLDGEVRHKDRDFTMKEPDYTVLMQVQNVTTNSVTELRLPAEPYEMEEALDRIGAETWSETVCRCLDCEVPRLTERITEGGNIAIADRAANLLDTLDAHRLSKYKALLEVMQPADLKTAVLLMDTVEQYVMEPKIRSPTDVAKEQLKFMLCESDAALLEQYLNLTGYGEALMKQDHAVLTEYGYFQRRDCEPILAPESKQKTEMEMKF